MGNTPAGQFGSKTTADEVVEKTVRTLGHDLKGRVYVVTGGNCGIGKETARALAAQNATVILGCRNVEKGKAAEREIIEETKNNNVEFIKLDLASFQSIREFVANFYDRELPLHALINNAGLVASEYAQTEQGFELTFGVSHVGHFLLTSLLLDILKTSAPSRVVNVSSLGHMYGKFDVSTLPAVKFDSYGSLTGLEQYANVKLYNVMFSHCLNRKLFGSGVTSYTLHPGSIKTEIMRNQRVLQLGAFLGTPFMKSIPQGAATSVFCAISPEALPNAGKYFSDCQVADNNQIADSLESQDQLWDLTEQSIKDIETGEQAQQKEEEQQEREAKEERLKVEGQQNDDEEEEEEEEEGAVASEGVVDEPVGEVVTEPVETAEPVAEPAVVADSSSGGMGESS